MKKISLACFSAFDYIDCIIANKLSADLSKLQAEQFFLELKLAKQEALK